MKKRLMAFLLVNGFCLSTFCQDIIVLKNGDEIKAKVSEVLPDIIKYKKWDNQTGPVYSEAKSNIFMIKYKNGSKDVFNTTPKATESSNNINNVQQFLGDWRCSSGSGGIVRAGDNLKISMVGGNITVALWHDNRSTQNTGFLKDGKIKVSFPQIGETEITYAEVSGKASVYVFGTQMARSLRSSTTPAYTGVLMLDSSQAIVSVVFRSVEDEIANHEELLINKLLDLLKSNKRIRGIHSDGIDTTSISHKYRLVCELKTFYDAKPSQLRSGSTAYTSSIRLTMQLLKIDNSGNIIKGVAADNKLIKVKETLFGGTYITKQGAFEATLPEIDKPFNQDLYDFFPITGMITDITEATRKGDPKRVKISCGANQGVMKGYKFRIIDDVRKNADYDLEADQLSDDYSVCIVKNNESIVAGRFRTNAKIYVTTNLNPEKDKNIETYTNKTAVSTKITNAIGGSWYGNVTQKGIKKSYSIQFSCNPTIVEYKVNYPTLGCSGNWVVKKVTELTMDFEQQTLIGQNSCTSGGIVTVTLVNDTQLELTFYSMNSNKVIAHGTATKE